MPSKYYPCLFCPRGQFSLEYYYKTDKDNYLYDGKCDRCGADYTIRLPEKIEGGKDAE